MAASANRDAARQLWAAVRGDDHAVVAGTFCEAVCDLLPTRYLDLVAASDVAAAYAFELLWGPLQAASGSSPFEWREAARAGWQDFVARAERAEIAAEGFGFDLSSAWEHERDVVGSECISTEDVEAIAKLAGRMFAALKALKASRVAAAPEEVHSIELGNDVGRLLPTELMHLGEPTEVLLLARIVDRRALQYAMRGRAEVSRGPLVVALDESSSMHDEGDRARNVWAKAAAIALARTALDDGRAVTVVHYSTSCTETKIPARAPEKLVALARHFLGGGTDICQALKRAAAAVADMAAEGDKGADVVLVSDGCDHRVERSCDDGTGRTRGQEALDAIEATGARLWTVAVDCEIDGVLRERAQRYVEVSARDVRTDRSVGKLAEVVQ